MIKTRTYSDLIEIPDFEGRYDYLREYSNVGAATFGFERWLNQAFYTSREWKRVRQEVIARDLGLDLGVEGHEVWNDIIVHHMNPIASRDVKDHDQAILNPEYLISVSLRTHNAIHFGSADQLERPFTERRRGDTKLW
jgi:hypothetical protein